MTDSLQDELTCCLDHVCRGDRSNCELIFNPEDVRLHVERLKKKIQSRARSIQEEQLTRMALFWCLRLIDEEFGFTNKEVER